ncbi:hypothetical protein NP493_1948g00014 [Ridgeia piscesae]|uniref:Chitin-binding type-2 domain-containing protein n=1 Tax=Ridgeia piscesae TaxID=27915 RepID=A0AAD9JQE6_RIDPI|nr:hypothetical protein NP493_1948g00014 [Ridgeia piscesae]
MNKLIFVVLALAAVTVSADHLDSCDGRPDGHYPCVRLGGPHYFSCYNGLLTYLTCQNHLCYNPYNYLCQQYCPTGYHGISSCAGKRNGDYQDCFRCDRYVTCSNGIRYERPCPCPLVWDDHAKRCLWTSNTCRSFYK